ncbi:MAG: glycosyltransferase family 4 protein, partial [Sphingopyxis sp.]
GQAVEWVASDADLPPASGPDDATITVLPLGCINPVERLTGLPMPIPGPRALASLSRAIDRADAVIVHDALYITSIAALVMAKIKRKPVILIQHIAGIEFASRIMRAVMRLANALVTRPMLRAADQVVFISDTVRAAFATVRFRAPPQLIFNGVNAAVFRPDAAQDRAATRHSLGLPQTGKLLTFVGRFVEKKGLAIIRELARARPDLTLAMVGAGPIDPAAWALPNVYLLGTMAPPQLTDLYRASDVLLLPSVGEGYPLVIQEALACGLPVICGEESARADPATTPWLRGVAIDNAKPQETAQAIAIAIDGFDPSPETRSQMAQYAAANYSWSAMAQSLTTLASRLVKAR